MIRKTIPTEAARDYYDWLGIRHDLGGRTERKAKDTALSLLGLQPGQRVLNVAVGTGKEQMVLADGVGEDGLAVGVDISREMLTITQERVPRSGLAEANGRFLPFATNTFDRVLCTYLLDLIDLDAIPDFLANFYRVLAPGGQLVAVSLTPGVGPASKAVIGLWTAVYLRNPLTLGGCRPLELYPLVQQAGFVQVTREVVVQLGVPSEVVTAVKPG